ncbi:PHB depolymerase family esterase [Actinoplanes sp. NEAU-A12]|uniref:PHB depolymerase family esterase n=1 Tax=Actinoplanes sandaracinus TaxID=3045177 RepID=A0ABT6WV83_9ACTN|nr:PHB depolymerase family esterase [Actinoplanes sandaracinus]MDI6103661.1 PHB depolymerase family esterase [Actinoplanes sandaracinus]
MRRIWRTLLAGAVTAAAIATGITLQAGPAAAASLQEVNGFGTNPTNLRMHLYVPDRLAPRPALLVAVHYCTGSGPAFHSGTEFASLADQYGFIVVYPSATRSGNCFDVSTPGALTHNGNSDPVGIVSMVRYVQQRYGTDVGRTFVTGASSGAMTTNVLLGDYPDVFAAGSAFAGVPFGCFATTNGSLWNSACANGQVSRTPQAWGDLVRAAYPGYTGRRPRMQVFHGTDDTTLRYPNFGEQIKQWTNVLGVSQTPTATDTPRPGWTRTRYGANTTQAPVEGVSVAGGSHSMPMSGMARMAIAFFGLDTTTPSPSTPPVPSPSTSPAGGSCSVRAAVTAWNTGLTTNLTVTNTGATALNGWSLTFTLPSGQTIGNGWNATYTPASGQVTARNAGHNGTVAPGASVTIGYQATHTGNAGAPAGYALNGSACSTV